MYIFPSQKYEENVDNNSIWITATPSPAALSLPFYIMEAGHFYARQEYELHRDRHNSFLLLYTLHGEGTLHANNTCIKLPPNSCAVIDCHTPHEYYCSGDSWDFLWLHFNGSGALPLLQILYPDELREIRLQNPDTFQKQLLHILELTLNNSIISCTESSAAMHAVFHILLQTILKSEQMHQKDTYSKDIQTAVDYIQMHYRQSITIDDIIENIPISKYHFIRLFRRIMGVTPYHYLTNYRINHSKILLRTTDFSVSEIAEACGFLDTSNFISHFKKHTGVRPTHYRKYFSETKSGTE